MVTTMTLQNPIVECRADPHVTLHTDGYYYFTASVPEYDRIEVRRARTLDALSTTEEIATVWTKPDQGKTSDLIWAPEMHYVDDHWVIYFAAAPNREIKDGAFQHRMYGLVCRDDNPLTGTWEPVVQIDSGIDSFCLDATVFKHQDQWYYLWAQKDPVIPGNSCLYIATLSDSTTLSSDAVMISKPEYDWEVRGFLVNEGPAVIKRNGKIFISYSASATDERYCMGLLTADESAPLLDPLSWHKSDTPVFESVPEKSIFGPGHNSFTTTPDGSQDLMIYHARNYTDIEGDPLWDPNRHACVHKLSWDAEGYPVFGEPEVQVVLA